MARFRIPARVYARLIVYFLASWTVIGVLAHGLFPLALAVVALVALYTTVPLFLFLRSGGWPFYPGAAFRLLVLRPFWYTQLLLFLTVVSACLGIVVGALLGHALLGGRVLGGIVALFVGSVLLAGYAGSKRLIVKRLVLELPNLAADLSGLRIVQITDLHVGPHTSRRFLRRVAGAVRDARPDLIAITGDLIDDRPEDVRDFARELGDLEAPLGVFIIPGNHDVYAGWSDVRHELERAQLGTILVNDFRVVERGQARLAIVGTGDPAGRQMTADGVAPDVDKAMSGVPRDMTVLALAHNPSLWPALAERGVHVTLSGHTHWGQFAIPQLNWSLASAFLKHAMGLYRENGSTLYISPGTGYWGIPFRIGAPSEVTVLELQGA